MEVTIKIPQLKVELGKNLSMPALKRILESKANEMKIIKRCRHDTKLDDKRKIIIFLQYNESQEVHTECRPFCQTCIDEETSIFLCGNVKYHMYEVKDKDKDYSIKEINYNGLLSVNFVPKEVMRLWNNLVKEPSNPDYLMALALFYK